MSASSALQSYPRLISAGTDLVKKSTTQLHSLVTVSAIGCPPGVSDGVDVNDPYDDESRDQLTLRMSIDDRYCNTRQQEMSAQSVCVAGRRGEATDGAAWEREGEGGELTWNSTNSPPSTNANAFAPFLINTPAQIPHTAPKVSS